MNTKILYFEKNHYFDVIFPAIEKGNKIFVKYGIDREQSLNNAGLCSILLMLADHISGIYEIPSDKEGYGCFIESKRQTDRIFIHRASLIFSILSGRGDLIDFINDIYQHNVKTIEKLKNTK